VVPVAGSATGSSPADSESPSPDAAAADRGPVLLWRDLPAVPLPRQPQRGTPPPAYASAPDCVPGQLTAKDEGNLGAAGSVVYHVGLTNVGTTTCLARGWPSRVTGTTRAGANRTFDAIVEPPGAGPTPPDVSTDVPPGGHAALSLDSGHSCGKPNYGTVYAALDIVLGSGARVHVTEDQTAHNDGGWIFPCGGVGSSRAYGSRQPRQLQGSGTAGDLQVTLTVPEHVRAGQVIDYQLTLYNPFPRTVDTAHCPDYNAVAQFDDVRPRPAHLRQLACGARLHILAGHRLTLDMQLPAETQPGDGYLDWQLVTGTAWTDGGQATADLQVTR